MSRRSQSSETDHMRDIEAARQRYRPSEIRILLVAESPPTALDRFFYYEHVTTGELESQVVV